MNNGINSQKLFYIISSFLLVILIIFTLRENYANAISTLENLDKLDKIDNLEDKTKNLNNSNNISNSNNTNNANNIKHQPNAQSNILKEQKNLLETNKNKSSNDKTKNSKDPINQIIEVEKIKKMPGNFKIIIDKSKYKLFLFKGDKLVRTYIVSIGKNPDGLDKKQKGDFRTPEGKFYIISIHKSDKWLHEGKYAYGPWFLRLKTPWQGIGIHGTDEPEKLGTKASEGCIRLHNNDISELKMLVEEQVYSKNKVIVEIVAQSNLPFE